MRSVTRGFGALAKRKRLIAVGVYGITGAMPNAANALLVVILASFLPVEEFAVYGVCFALIRGVGTLSDCGISQAIFREYYDRHQSDEVSAYLARMLVAARFFSFAVMILMFFAGLVLWGPLTNDRIAIWPFMPLVLAAGFFERAIATFGEVCRALERPFAFSSGRIVQTVVLIAAAAILVIWLKMGVVGAVMALVAASVAGSLTMSAVLARIVGIGLRFDRAAFEELKDALRYGVPLLPNQFARYGRSLLPRLVLIHVTTMAQVGIFVLGSTLAALLQALTQPIELALRPQYFKRRVDGAEGFRDNILAFGRVFLASMTIVSFFLILFVGEIVTTFFPPDYAGAAPVAAVLIVAGFLQMQTPILMRQMLYHRSTGRAAMSTAIPMALFLVALPFAVPAWGLIAAAWLLALANALAILMLRQAIRRHEEPDHPLGTSALLGMALVAVAWWVSEGGGDASLQVRAAVALAATLCCSAIWIWPNRRLVRRILRH